MSPCPAREIGALECPRILVNKLEQCLHHGHHWDKYTTYGEAMSKVGSPECSAKHCSKCGARGRCIGSRHAKDYVRRRYVCGLKGCEHRWTTAEFLVDEGFTKSRDKVKPFRDRQMGEGVMDAINRLTDVIQGLK